MDMSTDNSETMMKFSAVRSEACPCFVQDIGGYVSDLKWVGISALGLPRIIMSYNTKQLSRTLQRTPSLYFISYQSMRLLLSLIFFNKLN